METTTAVKVNRDYYMVRYSEGCYMGAEHPTVQEAIDHITTLKNDKDAEYRNRVYDIVHFVETMEVIDYPVYL